MMDLLILRIVTIRTGLKGVFVLCVVLALHSCGIFEEPPNRISGKGYVINTTEDTIFCSFKSHFFSSAYVSDNIIYPNDSLSLWTGSLNAEQKGDPIDAFVSDGGSFAYFVYSYDSAARAYAELDITFDESRAFVPDQNAVLCHWEPPLKEMGEDNHHFFNRSSWVTKPRETDDGGSSDKWFDVYFTITDDDIKQE